MLDEPLVEVALRLRVDLVAEVDVASLGRVLRVHLLRDVGVGGRLAAAVIAHQHDVLEAGRHRLLGDALEDCAEELRREADGARQIGARVVRRVREHRHRDRVAEPLRDRPHDLAAHEGMAAVHVLRPALLGAAGVEQGGRLAGGHRGLHFRPRHHLELDEVFFRGGRLASSRRRGRGFGRRLRERGVGGEREHRKNGKQTAHDDDSFESALPSCPRPPVAQAFRPAGGRGGQP